MRPRLGDGLEAQAARHTTAPPLPPALVAKFGPTGDKR
jgi:hypothetical protein